MTDWSGYAAFPTDEHAAVAEDALVHALEAAVSGWIRSVCEGQPLGLGERREAVLSVVLRCRTDADAYEGELGQTAEVLVAVEEQPSP